MQTLSKPRVSIVVASHRRAYVAVLAAALSTDHSGAEIIIVADYPVDDLMVTFPRIVWQHIDDTGISVKRNAGSRRATAEIIAFTDDDCIPEPGWVEKGLSYLDSQPNAGGVEGKTVIDDDVRSSAPIGEFKRLEQRGYRTNNIFYRRDVFEAVGGFDERFTVQREDVDLAYTVLSTGRDIGYCETAVVTHRVRDGERWDLLKNCVNRRFDPLLFKKHPRLYRKHIGTPFTPAIGVVLFFHVLVLLSFVTAPGAILIFAAADVTAALALSVRRNASGTNGLSLILRDWLSFLASPLVLLGVLLYGSVRFGKWLAF